jgi:5-methylcytosine-specific restriction endonuclease McrA
LYEGGQNERVNPDYLKWRKAVLKRDKGYCRLCHSKTRLEVHHIYRFATYPEKRWQTDNGITLCHDCHVGFRNREDEYVEELSCIAMVKVEVWHV